jgi:cohesin complex subunit SA-1/2
MANMPSTHSEDWQPLMNYRNSLLHGESDQVGPVPVSKKVYTRKGKKNQAGDDDGDDPM